MACMVTVGRKNGRQGRARLGHTRAMETEELKRRLAAAERTVKSLVVVLIGLGVAIAYLHFSP